MNFIKQILNLTASVFNKAVDTSETIIDVADTVAIATHDVVQMAHQETMKMVIGVEQNGALSDEQIEQYAERKVKLANAKAKAKQAMRNQSE